MERRPGTRQLISVLFQNASLQWKRLPAAENWALRPTRSSFDSFRRWLKTVPALGLFLAVDFSMVTLRALVAGMERGVWDGNPIGAGKRRVAIAPTLDRSRYAGLQLACRRPSGRTARVFSVLCFRTSLSAMACSAVLSFWPSDSFSTLPAAGNYDIQKLFVFRKR